MLVLTAGLAAALSPPASAIEAKVSHFTLKNGMEVLVIPDRRAPVVTHMVWYRVGSADEPTGKSGIAHFLEHLLFRGTKKIAPGDFSKIVKHNGGEDNAFTSQDFTAYYQRISKDRLDLVMGLEADRIANLTLNDNDVKTELKVVQEERRSRTDNDPMALLSEQVSAALYLAHPYRRPVIGWMDEVERLDKDDAMAFYRTYYTPRNAILVVAGDVSEDEVRVLAKKHYEPLANTADPGKRLRTNEPKPLAARRVNMYDARASNPVLYRSYLTVSFTSDSKQAYALEVLAKVLGGGTTSRLYRQLVVERKLASYASAWFSGSSRDSGNFGLHGVPTAGKTLPEVEAAIDELIAEIAKNGIEAKELERAKASLVADTIYQLDSQFRLAYTFGVALTSGRTVEDVLATTRNIEAVTLAQVKAAAASLKVESSVTGYLRKQRKTATLKSN